MVVARTGERRATASQGLLYDIGASPQRRVRTLNSRPVPVSIGERTCRIPCRRDVLLFLLRPGRHCSARRWPGDRALGTKPDADRHSSTGRQRVSNAESWTPSSNLRNSSATTLNSQPPKRYDLRTGPRARPPTQGQAGARSTRGRIRGARNHAKPNLKDTRRTESSRVDDCNNQWFYIAVQHIMPTDSDGQPPRDEPDLSLNSLWDKQRAKTRSNASALPACRLHLLLRRCRH